MQEWDLKRAQAQIPAVAQEEHWCFIVYLKDLSLSHMPQKENYQ